MYHYRECGLDNVFLRNGYTVTDTEYGRMVSIEDTKNLQEAIGRSLVDSPAALTGSEFRFLRHEMELSQRELAALINADEQSVRRWEKYPHRPVKGPGERMLRVLYLAFVGDAEIRVRIERLAELDVAEPQQRRVMIRNGVESACDWKSEFETA